MLDLAAFTFEYSYFKAMTIIAKLSFWILQPPKKEKSIIADSDLSFEDVILGALDQFRTEGYVEKLQTNITQGSLPSNKDDVLEYLYNQITRT